MKLIKNSIFSAVHPAKTSGTTFYAVTLEQIIDTYSKPDNNVWIMQSFIESGWDAIDYDNNLFGSQIIDDVLYICVTDGRDIIIDDENVDPEEALELYDIDDLGEYIQPASDQVIKKYITEYELNMPDFDKWAPSMISSKYDFTKLVDDYMEFASL